MKLAARARALGATHAVEPGEAGSSTRCRPVVPGGVDVAFEVVGCRNSSPTHSRRPWTGGRCVMVGSPPAGQPIPLDGRALFSERRLLGTTGGSNVPERDIARHQRLYAAGDLDLDMLRSTTHSLDEFDLASPRPSAGRWLGASS